MFHFLLKSIFRLIAKNRVLTFVKLSGLIIAGTVFILTVLFCVDELNHDLQHPEAANIFRYVHRVNTPEGLQSFAFTSATIGPALVQRFPEVKSFVRILFPPNVSVRNSTSDQPFNESKFAFADSTFFHFFNFPMERKTLDEHTLDAPMKVVLTPAMATKYFGDEDPVGRTLIVNSELVFTVSGVLESPPNQTHLDFDFIASFSSLEIMKNNPVIAKQIPAAANIDVKGFSAFYTYLLIENGKAEDLIAKFPAFIEEFRGKGRSDRLKPTLQALTSIHLDSDMLYEIKQNGSRKIVGVYFLTGLIILIVASINYVNISTAEFINRARGIALKKILGVSKLNLLFTHLLETTLFCLFSMILALILAGTLLPLFNTLVHREIFFYRWNTLYVASAIFFGLVLLSGIYPAFASMRGEPVIELKGAVTARRGSFNLRNALVFFQLMISFCLLTIAMLIYAQIDFLLSMDLGFQPRQVISLNATTVAPKERIALRDKLKNVNAVESVGMTSLPPGDPLLTLGILVPENAGDEERRITMYQSYVDQDYLHSLGVKIHNGRFFSEQFAADSVDGVIVNEKAAEMIGGNLIGKDLKIPSIFSTTPSNKRVVGVMQDFSFTSLHQELQPMILEYSPQRCNYILVRFSTGSAHDVVVQIEKEWKALFPAIPFDYTFLDEKFRKFYEDDTNQRTVIMILACIAIGLSSLGIFGTALFQAQAKAREVSIRKILGLERQGLLLLMFRPSVILLSTACIIGIPVSYKLGHLYLETFAAKINFSPMLYAISFVMILVVIVASNLYEFLKVTKANPVDVLRQ
jgi:putative ABC transport system permease protein